MVLDVCVFIIVSSLVLNDKTVRVRHVRFDFFFLSCVFVWISSFLLDLFVGGVDFVDHMFDFGCCRGFCS